VEEVSKAGSFAILLLEDDKRLGETIRLNLELRNFKVTLCSHVQTARDAIKVQTFAAYLLDIELPDGDGIELCGLIRARDPEAPILLITARTDEQNALRGLSAGADDYIRKPFGLRELALRLEKMLLKYRRVQPKLQVGQLELCLDQRQALYAGRDLQLGRKEFELLRLFVGHPDRVYSRHMLLDSLQGEQLQDRTIDSHISHLRRKLAQAGCQDLHIVSVYGEGYRLKREVS
jgi:DNA-binding response OmpR family regulator